MARGDAFVDAYLLIPANTTVEIRPANGVEIMIFHILGNIESIVTYLRGRDSSGNETYNFEFGMQGGESSATSVIYTTYFFNRSAKIVITNTEYISLKASSTASTVAIFGIQIK